MKYFLLLIPLVTLLAACGESKRSNYVSVDENGNQIMSKESNHIMENLIAEFMTCRSNSTENLQDCKHFIAKAICTFYQIEDFKMDGEYVDYHEMHKIIRGKFGTWKKIGAATDQETLDKAQKYANNGRATVAISVKDAYGHVAMIIPGETVKAASWNNLNVPNCASFFLTPRLEPFFGKSLAYAWRSPEDILLYTRSK